MFSIKKTCEFEAIFHFPIFIYALKKLINLMTRYFAQNTVLYKNRKPYIYLWNVLSGKICEEKHKIIKSKMKKMFRKLENDVYANYEVMTSEGIIQYYLDSLFSQKRSAFPCSIFLD